MNKSIAVSLIVAPFLTVKLDSGVVITISAARVCQSVHEKFFIVTIAPL